VFVSGPEGCLELGQEGDLTGRLEVEELADNSRTKCVAVCKEGGFTHAALRGA
jgi:hypothetical protein